MSIHHPRRNEGNYQRARTDKIIAAQFKSSLMNDTKWVRLLDTLSMHEGLVYDCWVKLVWDDTIRRMAIDGVSRDFDFWPHAMEGMISGQPTGWYDYKEIEWIEFPADNQDLARIESVVRHAGQFMLSTTENGLRLYCYQ